ncbi:hypothetical protein [Streptomyces sp. TE33382]
MMIQVLNLFQYASRLSRRTVATALASALVAATVVGVIVWAPLDRAQLVIGILGPIISAIAATVITDMWKRRRQ